MTKQEIIEFQNITRRVLFWKDPDPLPENDYEISSIMVGDETSLITYNEGASTAEVYNHEIEIRNIYSMFQE